MVKTPSKTFCIIPWIHLHAWPNGEAYLCCVADAGNPQSVVGDLSKENLNDVINSDKMKQIRLDMLEGKQVPNCKSCYKAERYNEFSWRHSFNHDFKDLIQPALADMKSDGSITPSLKYIDFRFSNFCNLECKTCGGDLSSSIASSPHRPFSPTQIQWMKEKNVYGPGNTISFVYAKKDFINDELKEHIHSARAFYFAGGEPLIQREHFEILSYLDTNKMYDKSLRYSSNMSNLVYKGNDLLEIWKKFDQVWVMASVDHYGEKLEYIRQNVNSQRLFENIDKLIENKIAVSMSPVVSVYSVYYLYDFVEFLESKGYLNVLKQIDWLNAFGELNSPTILPKFAKKELINKLQVDMESDLFKRLYERYPNSKNFMEGLISLIQTEPSRKKFEDFIWTTERNDLNYKTDVNRSLPWLGYVIEKYKRKKNES